MADIPDRWERRRQRFEERMERRKARWEGRQYNGIHFMGGGMFIGVLLAGVGVLLLLQNLGILYVDDLWDYWPVILIVVGASKVFNSWTMPGRVWGGVMAFIGTLFLLKNLGLVHVIVWNYFWPAILIAVGVGMLMRGMDRDHPFSGQWDWRNHVRGVPGTGTPGAPGSGGAKAGASPAGAASAEYDDNVVNIDSVFSGTNRRIDSQDFQGGEITACFGGVELDLSRAAMKKDEVRIEANAIFGGIDIRVPDTWKVLMRGTGIFGGFGDETHPPPRADMKPPVLIVTGSAVFGGVNVKN